MSNPTVLRAQDYRRHRQIAITITLVSPDWLDSVTRDHNNIALLLPWCKTAAWR